MNYKLQIHFLNDVTMWSAYVPALINMNTIKSPYLYQFSLHSNGNGFKVLQKGFIKSLRDISPWLHMSTVIRNDSFNLNTKVTIAKDYFF